MNKKYLFVQSDVFFSHYIVLLRTVVTRSDRQQSEVLGFAWRFSRRVSEIYTKRETRISGSCDLNFDYICLFLLSPCAACTVLTRRLSAPSSRPFL